MTKTIINDDEVEIKPKLFVTDTALWSSDGVGKETAAVDLPSLLRMYHTASSFSASSFSSSSSNSSVNKEANPNQTDLLKP